MFFKLYDKKNKNLKLEYHYYYVVSNSWFDSKCCFSNMEDALKHSIGCDETNILYNIYLVNIYSDEKGVLYKNEDFLCKIPTIRNSDITYYVLGTIIDGKIYFLYDLGAQDIVDERLLKTYKDIDELCVFKINTKLKDKNKMITNYELVRTFKSVKSFEVSEYSMSR